MRRKGVLTGYLWNRNSSGKVKVKGKPTNASNASGRCIRAKCSLCHDLPVSKAKSKTKGRNKHALSRLLVDDEWAYCKRTSAGRGVKVVPSHVDRYTLDACHSDAELSGHDVDDDSYDVYDACHAGANPMGHEVKDDDLDHDINIADDVSDAGMHAHDDVKDVGLMRADDGYYYAMWPHQVFGMDGKLYTVTDRIRVVFAGDLKKVVPDVNPTKDNDVIVDNDDDVNYGCHTTMAHAKDDVALEEEEDANNCNANQESHAMMVQAAEDVSDDDDDVYGDEDTNDFQSLISGLVNVGLPTCNNNNEEVLEVECEENSLSGDWCYVTSLDAIDDWYLC